MLRTERLTPQLIRIVFGGPGLEGFAAGPFTDHYVKLQLPPAGAGYEPPFDLEWVKAETPARALAAGPDLLRARLGSGAHAS